jgi:hypothetical protein
MKRTRLAAVLAFAAVLGFFVALLTPAPAEAIPSCGWHAYYYSDSSLTTLIGERWVTIKSCGCVYQGWGYAAGWIDVVDEPVCGIEP